MKCYFTLLLFFLSQISFSQLLDAPTLKNGLEDRNIKLNNQTAFSFRDYGDLWFSTLEDLIELGEIPDFDEQPVSTPVLIFPDSTIYAGYSVDGPYTAQIHGIADVVNPSTLPSDYNQDWYWAKVVIDSVSIPYAYFRNTDDSIIDTVFIDYINHISFEVRVGHIPLNGDEIIDPNEFIHQPLLHTGNTDELDSGMVFRTDTVVLTADSETDEFARLINVNTNDTVAAGERYGVYLRFRPGYEWNPGNDTLTNYNMFGIFMREQNIGERPNVYWDPLAGFGSYLNTIISRYNMGPSSGNLLIGFVGDESFEYEHAYIRYKMATNELSTPEVLGLNDLKLFPNPVSSGIVNLTFNSIKQQNLTFRILDMYGRLLYSNGKTISAGTNNLLFDLPNLSTGTYQFVVGDFAQKLVVK